MTYAEKSHLKRYLYLLLLIVYVIVLGVANLIYVDESGVNKAFHRAFGRAKAGGRVHGTVPGKRCRRTNIIAGLWGKKHVAVQCYEHSTTSLFFEDWFEFELLAAIPEFSLIIMDNATFHRKKRIFKIAERHNVFVLFLPPYSPDLNPIEKSWANFKRWLCDNFKRFPNLQWAAECYFE